MGFQEVVDYFKKEYPDKNIVSLPQEDPAEIICEIEPAQNHPSYSKAVAAILKSKPHYHKQSAETYRVIKGELSLYVDGQCISLAEGETHLVRPGQTHYAEGNFTLVEVSSSPGWTLGDHYLVSTEPA